MVIIEGYRYRTYGQVIGEIHRQYLNSELTCKLMAQALNVKSISTVQNCLKKNKQVVSDLLLTRFASQLNINLLIVWNDGKRYYYLPAPNFK